MDILKKYRVFCVHENAFIETWKHTKPEFCPNSSKHEIDPSQTTVIDTKFVESSGTAQQVYINSKTFHNTNGFYRAEGLNFDIPSVGIHEDTYTFPIQVCLFGMRICVGPEHKGDSVSIIMQPNMPIGFLTHGMTSDSTIISVPEIVVGNLIPGFFVVIGGEERQIVRVDRDAHTIQILSPFATEKIVGSPITLNVYIIKDLYLNAPGNLEVGYGAFGGKVTRQNDTLRLIYNNRDQSSKEFSINMEYMY